MLLILNSRLEVEKKLLIKKEKTFSFFLHVPFGERLDLYSSILEECKWNLKFLIPKKLYSTNYYISNYSINLNDENNLFVSIYYEGILEHKIYVPTTLKCLSAAKLILDRLQYNF